MTSDKRAVVLLSGGLDSATALALARGQGYQVATLTVDYGQRHRQELECARRVSQALGAWRHTVVTVDLRALGGSALTAGIDVPKDRALEEIGQGIPITYVPARNTVDYSGYPDCRPEFLTQFERLANLATKAAVEGQGVFRIHAPLLNKTKAEIIQHGMRLGVDYSLTLSCYDPDPEGRACGRCDS